MRLRLRLLAAAALLAAGLPTALLADVAPLTPAQTASLARAIFLLTTGLVPPPAPGAPPAYSVTPEGDHYRLSLPLPAQIGASGVALQGAFTAQLRPAPSGAPSDTWAFDDLQGPYPLSINSPPDPLGKRVSTAVNARGQTGHVVIDPSLATTSTFDMAADGMTLNSAGPAADAVATFGKVATHASWDPAGAGRVDVSATLSMQDVSEKLSGMQNVTVTMRGMRGDGHVTGYAPDQAARLVAAAPPPGARPPLTEAQRQVAHRLLAEVRDLCSGFTASTTMDGLAVEAGDHRVTLDRVALSESAAAPDGKADLRLRVALQGLASPDIPDTARDYVPRRLVLAPRISGVPTRVIFDLLDRAIDRGKPDAADMDATAAAVFAQGPISASLDEVAFDVGPATLTATGTVQAAAPDPASITGTAEIEVAGFNALLDRVLHDPVLKKGAAMMVFLKGIGQEDGSGKVVWKIAYADRKVRVNGTDRSTLMPH